MSTLLGYCAMVCAPAGLIVSVVGLVKDRRRGQAIAGVALGVLLAALVGIMSC